jgi:hypothetical protein
MSSISKGNVYAIDPLHAHKNEIVLSQKSTVSACEVINNLFFTLRVVHKNVKDHTNPFTPFISRCNQFSAE